MKSNRVLGVGGIIFITAFAMGTLAQASPLSGVPLATDESLSMADTMGTSTDGISSTATDLSFDACSGGDCSETEEAASALTSGGGGGNNAISLLSVASPEPATFVLVGLTLAVLPLMRKRRS